MQIVVCGALIGGKFCKYVRKGLKINFNQYICVQIFDGVQ